MANKITKRDSFISIIEVLKGAERTDLVEVMEHEIELLDKKKASGKMTKTQVANEDIKVLIVEELARLAKPVSITELISESTEIAEKCGNSNQKVSALMTQLKNAGAVVRTTEGKKALFSVADSEDAE